MWWQVSFELSCVGVNQRFMKMFWASAVNGLYLVGDRCGLAFQI